MSESTALQRLANDPAAFSFDAALRVLLQRAGVTDPAEVARFVSRLGLSFAPSDVLSVDLREDPPRVTLGLLGLIGTAGVLPRRYSEDAASDAGDALHTLLDFLAHRMLARLGQAGIKYRLDRAVEAARLSADGSVMSKVRAAHVEALLAVAGFAESDVGALPFGRDTLVYYAGLFALRPRSAERLAVLANDWLGHPVEVIEFSGAWLPIRRDQRSRLGMGREVGAFSTLGEDAAVGVQAWDPQARILLRVGPLDRASFEALLPNRDGLKALVGLLRTYLGFEVGFAINLVLAAAEMQPVQLDPVARPGPMLGWNTWLGRGKGYVARGNVDDARFAAEMVEGSLP